MGPSQAVVSEGMVHAERLIKALESGRFKENGWGALEKIFDAKDTDSGKLREMYSELRNQPEKTRAFAAQVGALLDRWGCGDYGKCTVASVLSDMADSREKPKLWEMAKYIVPDNGVRNVVKVVNGRVVIGWREGRNGAAERAVDIYNRVYSKVESPEAEVAQKAETTRLETRGLEGKRLELAMKLQEATDRVRSDPAFAERAQNFVLGMNALAPYERNKVLDHIYYNTSIKRGNFEKMVSILGSEGQLEGLVERAMKS